MDSSESSSLNLVASLLHFGTKWWFLPLCFILYRILLPIYCITLHPLARYPGPKLWAVSRLPWHIAMHSGNLHRRMLEFHEKYGPIVRIAPDEVSYAHADAWRDIYGDKNFGRNRIWFKRQAEEPESIMGSDESAHARLRRGFNGAFTDAGVKEMSKTVATHVESMIKKLTEVVGKGGGEETVDLVNWLNFTTFDISGDLSFGEDFGSIKNAKAHPWVEISCQFGKAVAIVASINSIWPLNRMLSALRPMAVKADFDPKGTPKDLREKFMYHQGLTRDLVGKRLMSDKTPFDFIASVEKYNAEMTSKGSEDKIITREELDHNMTVFVFAGSETTSSALSGTLRYLLKDARVYGKLRKEIHGSFGKEDDITVAAVSKLEYLTAVLNEGLRLAPPPVIGVPRQAPERQSMVVCGKKVPGDTLVAINQYAANRASFNFTRAEEFIPERFLPEGRLEGDNMEMFQPFFTGRHLCIGYKLAWVMLRLILTRLVFAFDMELIDADKVGDFGQQKTFIFWAKEPLMIRLKRRDPTHLQGNGKAS